MKQLQLFNSYRQKKFSGSNSVKQIQPINNYFINLCLWNVGRYIYMGVLSLLISWFEPDSCTNYHLVCCLSGAIWACIWGLGIIWIGLGGIWNGLHFKYKTKISAQSFQKLVYQRLNKIYASVNWSCCEKPWILLGTPRPPLRPRTPRSTSLDPSFLVVSF